MFKDMDGQSKLVQKVDDVLDRANKKISVTPLRYSVDKPESSYAQIQKISRNTEDEKFHQIVYVKSKLTEFIYLLDVMKSVCDKVITK